MSKRKIVLNLQPEKPSSGISQELRFLTRENSLLLTGILVLTLLVFWNTTKNGFTDWDDDFYVVNSRLILHLDWSAFKSYFTTLTANLYTPLVTLSFALDYKLYGMNATGFHVTSLLLHGSNIILVYALTYLIFKRTFIAALSSLLFAIHPLNVEAVAWISSRKDLLFSMFYLVGLITYSQYKQNGKKIILALVFVFFLLSVLSKPIAFTFPVALLLIDFVYGKHLVRNNFLEKIPFALVSILVGGFGIYLVNKYAVFSTAPTGYNFFDKVCLAGYALSFYLYNALLPIDLSNYHAYPFKEGSFLSLGIIMAPFIVLLLVFSIYKYALKNITVMAGLILFLIILLPTLRLVPTGYPVAADRYFYLASVGLFWTIILLLEKVSLKILPLQYGIIALGILVIVSFCIISFKRIPEWKDSYTLWTATLKKNQNHEIANEHIGKLYMNAGNPDRALLHFQRIVNVNKTNYDILNSAGNILAEKNEPELALRYFDLAIATGKADYLPYYNRGMVYSSEGKFKEAIKDFNASVQIKNDFAEGYNNRGIARVKSGDTLGAYHDFVKAVNLKPSDRMMVENLSRVKTYIKTSQ